MGILATVTITAGRWSAGSQYYSFVAKGYDPALPTGPVGSLDSDPQSTQLTLYRNLNDSIPSWKFAIKATTPPAGWEFVKTGGMTFLKSSASESGGVYTWAITAGQSSLLAQDTDTVDLEYWDSSTSNNTPIDKNIISSDIIGNDIISNNIIS